MKHVPPPTGVPLDATLVPGDITVQDLPVAIGRLRKEARDEIYRLIGFLDTTDNYVSQELEDAVDDNPCDDDEIEPSLGWTDQESRSGRIANPADIDAELDNSDDEPSLGSIEDHPNGYQDGSDFGRGGRNQERWASGNSDDCEGDEHDGREPEHEDYDGRCDAEPSLGWTAAEAATGRGYAGVMGDGRRVDLEQQCEDEGAHDSGIGDADGLLEQCGDLYPYGAGDCRRVE